MVNLPWQFQIPILVADPKGVHELYIFIWFDQDWR